MLISSAKIASVILGKTPPKAMEWGWAPPPIRKKSAVLWLFCFDGFPYGANNISQKKRNVLISFDDYPENLYINIESYKLSNFVISSTLEEEASLIQNWKDFLVKGASTNWKSLERNWNWIFSNYLVYFGLDPNPSKRQSVFQ